MRAAALRSARRAPDPVVWVAGLGLAAWLLLPWYLPQDVGFWTAMWQALARPAADVTAPGAFQAAWHGRPWLWAVGIALALALVATRACGARRQGRWWVGSSLLGLLALLGGGFTIGVQGWAFEAWTAALGPLPKGQPGIGLGAALALLALLVLLGMGLARLGALKGDRFVASLVVVCSALLLLFVAMPVLGSFSSALQDDAGAWAPEALWARLAHDRIWGLGCLAGGVRCGTAWNTLWLALLTAAGTTVMGTLIALWAERGLGNAGPGRAAAASSRLLNLLALLPIITPPFVVGLGLILLLGRAGLVNQLLEAAFGIEPTRWFYGLFGIWLAQMFAFTPIAFMIMRGVVQGISPSLEEAAQTLRASRAVTFRTVTLPLLKPGLANAFLVGFIESIADFGNPIIVGGSYAVLSTDIFFAIVGAQYDQGRAATLALILTGFALIVFLVQQRLLHGRSFTTVSGKGDGGLPLPLPDGVRRLCRAGAGPWLAFTAVVYLFAFVGGFVQTWGRDYTPTLRHLVTAFDLQWGTHGLVWAGTAWNSLFTTLKLASIAAPVCAGLGLLIAWLLARTQFKGQRVFEFAVLLAFAIPGTVLGVSYVLAFNVPPFELTGTALIIVLCFVFRNLPV
ncbi:MAG: ABC transporter permease, partial [Aquabacterium sp.]